MGGNDPVCGWRGLSLDPTAARCLSERRAQLEEAWTDEKRDRLSFILDACRGRKVLDVGCVNHDPEAIVDPDWMHSRIAAVAGDTVGVDTQADGIRRMVAAGFDAVCTDVSAGAGPLASRCPFDVVVAGEVIEHLRDPGSLLEFARDVLRPGGTLIVTTPNPYSLSRVRAGRLRLVWENVDHVTYLFPSGVAELADRAGLMLRTSTTVGIDPPVVALKRSLKALAVVVGSRLRASAGRPTGTGLLPMNYIPVIDLVRHRCLTARGRRGSQLGETAIYVLEKRT